MTAYQNQGDSQLNKAAFMPEVFRRANYDFQNIENGQ